jgi:hypothetical protein
MRYVGDVVYLNTGDWVESRTAVAETDDGAFEIIHWSQSEDRPGLEPLIEELEAAA